MKYIVWIQERYATGYKPHEFATAAELANAILNNELPKGDMVVTRRMKLTVTDAEEAGAFVTPAGVQPDPIPAAVANATAPVSADLEVAF